MQPELWNLTRGSPCLLSGAAALHLPVLCCCRSEQRGGYACAVIRWRGGAICSNFSSYCWLSSGSFGLVLITVHLTEGEGMDSQEEALGIGEVLLQTFCSSNCPFVFLLFSLTHSFSFFLGKKLLLLDAFWVSFSQQWPQDTHRQHAISLTHDI